MSANVMVRPLLLPRQQAKLAKGRQRQGARHVPNTQYRDGVIGIDIGKNSFHVVGHDARGAIVLRQKWSRGQVEAGLANVPPCLPVLCGRRSTVVGNSDALSGKADQNGFAERSCITVQSVPAFEILKRQFVGEEGLGIQFSDEPGSLLHQGRRDKAYTVVRIFSDVRRTS
jgi:hypothetical protein